MRSIREPAWQAARGSQPGTVSHHLYPIDHVTQLDRYVTFLGSGRSRKRKRRPLASRTFYRVAEASSDDLRLLQGLLREVLGMKRVGPH
jgi:hypothetical protein